MWTAMFDRYGLWSAPPRELDRFLAKALTSHDEVFDWARSTLPDRLHVLDFEQVMKDRDSVVAQLRRAVFDLPPETAPADRGSGLPFVE
jgi:hypothetical protein